MIVQLLCKSLGPNEFSELLCLRYAAQGRKFASGPMQHLEATEEHILILSEDWRLVVIRLREWSGDV